MANANERGQLTRVQADASAQSRRTADATRRMSEENLRRLTALLSTLLCTFVAHGFLFTNEFFSHDSISYFAYADWGFSFYLGVGRFLIPVYEFCKGGVAAPWLIGVLFTLWMSLTGLVITDLLEIRSLPGVALSCGLLCTNLSVALTGATYVYCMDEYALALLGAAAAAWLFLRGGRLALAGLLPLVLALAIYQPYFTVTAALCLLALLRRAATGRRVGGVIRHGILCLLLLAFAFLLYNSLWTVLRTLAHVAQRRDVVELTVSGPTGPIGRLLEANRAFFAFLFRPGVLGMLAPVVHALLLILFLWRLLLTLTDSRLPAANRTLTLALSCLLPAALHSVSLLMPGEAHDLTAFARELFYFLLLPLLEELPGQGKRVARSSAYPSGRWLPCVLLLLLLWQHVVFANQVYMKKDLEKNATLLLAARIVDRIESVEGYVPGKTRVTFAGRLDSNDLLDGSAAAFRALTGYTGLWHSHAATYNFGRYLTDYLHYPLLWDQETEIARTEVVRTMPAFPAAGSVRMLDGIVVVKLSDTAAVSAEQG